MTGPDSSGRGRGRVDWRQVKILYLREMRAALRERAIVVYSILLPIFLYPFVLWAAFTGILFVQGQTEGFVSRVEVPAWPKGHPALRADFRRDKELQLAEAPDAAGTAADRIRRGTLDALVEFLPAAGTNAALAGNFETRLTFDESKERSVSARDRVKTLIDQYRQDWLGREARARGVDAAAWKDFTLSSRNVASKKQMGAFVLGLVLPLLFVVMVAMGSFYPAIDATAGERERNTWETLMSTAASRVSIATAKYLYVATLGGLAGGLNLVAMALTMKPIFSSLSARAGEVFNFTVPLAAIPILALSVLLLAGFVAAGMLLFAAFARNFKEGQAMITPFYMVILLPVMFLQVPGLKFSLALALVPVVNVAMVVRSVVSGAFPWLQIGVTVAVSLLLIAGSIRLAAFILQFEDVMLGSYNGSWIKFLRERVFARNKPAGPASMTRP